MKITARAESPCGIHYAEIEFLYDGGKSVTGCRVYASKKHVLAIVAEIERLNRLDDASGQDDRQGVKR